MARRKPISYNPIHERPVKRVLITGGAGYIGSVLTRLCLEAGFKVRVLDTFWFGDQGIADIRDKVETIKADIRQFKDEYLKDVDGVIHLASMANDPTAEIDPKATHAINFEGTMRVAEACKRKDIRKFTFASSASVYGFNINEICGENTPFNPQSAYAQSKIDAEQGLISLAQVGGFFPVIFRQATTIGHSPRMRFDLVLNSMVRSAYMTGQVSAVPCFRPLIDVNDVALPHVNMMNLPAYRLSNFDVSPTSATRWQVYNLVGRNMQIVELGKLVAQIAGRHSGLPIAVNVDDKSPDSRSYQISAHKAMMGIGFVPTHGLEDAIVKLWDWIASGQADLNDPVYFNLKQINKLMKEGAKIL